MRRTKAPRWRTSSTGAVKYGDTHVIKFTEACLREWKVNPVPAYLIAARDLIGRRRALF